MTKCERVQTLFEQSLADKISLSNRLSMHKHILICSACKVYVSDSKKLHQKLKELHIKAEDLTLDERKRIIENL